MSIHYRHLTSLPFLLYCFVVIDYPLYSCLLMKNLMKAVLLYAHFASAQFQARPFAVCGVCNYLCIHVLFHPIVAPVPDHLVLRHKDIEIVPLPYAAVHLHDLYIRHPLRR
jgi:hypothetical protein